MSYDFIQVQTVLADLKKYNIARFVLSPTHWSSCQTTTLSWHTVKFDRSQKKNIPQLKGVYTFVLKPGIVNHPECAYLLYVGMTDRQNLRARFWQYFREKDDPKGREPVKAMLNLWEDYLWFCYAPINDVGQIGSIEAELIDAFVPPINQDYPGILAKAVKAWQ